MKKICFIMLSLIFTLTGCGKKNNVLLEASNNFKELKSYEMKLNIDTDVKNGNKKNVSKYYISGKYDNENEISRIYNKTDVGSILTTGFVILDKKNKQLYVSQNSKSWESVSAGNASLNGINFDKINLNLDESIFDILADGKILFQYQDDENGNLNYDVTISLSRIAKILSLSDVVEELNVNTDELVVNVSIDKETKNYTTIDISFESLLNDVTDENIVINNLSYVYSFDKFNSIEKIDIPIINVENNNTNTEDNNPNNKEESSTNQNYDFSEYNNEAFGFRKAVELYIIEKLVENFDENVNFHIVCDGVKCFDNYYKESIDINGKIPTSGIVDANSYDNITFKDISFGNVKCDIQETNENCHY